MKIVQATLWIYAAALHKSWQCVAKNWIVSFAPLAYGFIMSMAGLLALPLGFIGGFLLALASQACLSSGLHLIKNMIASGKANVDDFLNGFTAYLWDLLTVAFIIWIPMRIAAMHETYAAAIKMARFASDTGPLSAATTEIACKAPTKAKT